MNDPTDPTHRNGLTETNAAALSRVELEAKYGKVWNAEQLADEFVVTAIIALTVVARRRSDNAVGSLEFQNEPRFYFNWRPQELTD